MPKIRRSGQDWILDRFIGALGVNALMPNFMSFMASPIVGFNNADLDRIARRTEGLGAMRRHYQRAAEYREAIAQQAEKDGHVATARRHYYLAALCYGFVQYTIQEDHSAKKKALHDKCQYCYGKVIKFAQSPIEKVEIPFVDNPSYDSSTYPALLHLPAGPGPWPCVIFIPGTDMYKEQVPNPEDNIFAKRGLACLTIDGPGQGESLLRMLKVRVDTWNYERAVSAAIDYLQTRREIDPAKIVLFGVSTGSYWAPRAAIWEARHKDRIVAIARLAAQWDPSFVLEFEHAQPNFKSNFMYMAGVENEDDFDRKAPLHHLNDIGEIRHPLLICQGEFDELCTPETLEEIVRKASGPHEIRIYEDEFHPLGGVAVEAYEGVVDWINDRLAGKPMPQERLTRIAHP